MEIIFSFILFCVAIFICFYIPGQVIVSFLLETYQEKDTWNLSWIVGISTFILGNYILAWINVPFLYLLVVGAFLLYTIWRRKVLQLFPKEKWDIWIFAIILIGSLVFTSLSILSGFQTKIGEQFVGLNAYDGITHLAYIKNQILYFPPQHPEMVNVPLRGYHYFYDFLLSRFVIFFHFNSEDLLFRYFPLFISFIYGISFYSLAKKVTANIFSQRFILFFIYFGEGFAYFLSLIHSYFNPLTAQPMDIILDPSIVLSISLLVSTIVILPQIRKSVGYALLSGLFIGLLSQIKVYVGIIGLGMLFLYGAYLLVKDFKKGRLLIGVTITIAVILTAVTFLPNNFNSGRFIYAPFNFYDQFMQQKFFSKLHWGEILEIYYSHHNVIRLIQMELEAIGVYWLINLGIRALFLIKAKRVLTKEFWTIDDNVLIFLVIAISIGIPSFFIQSPSPFEVMQFTWISNIFFGIPVSIILGDFFLNKNKISHVLVVVLVIIFCFPYTFALGFHYLYPKGALQVQQEYLAVFEKITISVSPKEYYIVLPDRETYVTKDGHLVDQLLWYAAPLSTALTGRSAYYEASATPFTGTKVQDLRKKQMYELSDSLRSCDVKETEKILGKVGTKYILTYYPQLCWSTSSAVLVKQETNAYSFYKFK